MMEGENLAPIIYLKGTIVTINSSESIKESIRYLARKSVVERDSLPPLHRAFKENIPINLDL